MFEERSSQEERSNPECLGKEKTHQPQAYQWIKKLAGGGVKDTLAAHITPCEKLSMGQKSKKLHSFIKRETPKGKGCGLGVGKRY